MAPAPRRTRWVDGATAVAAVSLGMAHPRASGKLVEEFDTRLERLSMRPAVRNLWNILGFGWQYLRRYRARFTLGIALGILFGFSGALILGTSNLLFERLDPQRAGSAPARVDSTQAPAPALAPVTVGLFREWTRRWRARSEQWADRWLPAQGQPMTPARVFGVLFLLPAIFAFRGFVGYFSSYCLGWVSERVINDVRLDLLIKLNSLSLDFFNRSATGDLLTRVNADTVALQRSLNLGLSDLVKEPVTVLAILGWLFFLDPGLTLFVLVFLPACVIPVAVLGRKARQASKGNVAATVSQSSLLVEVLASIRVVKAFNLESLQVERFRRFSRDLIHHGMKGIQARELANPIIETVSALGLGVLIVYIFYSNRSLSQMVIFLISVGAIYTPVKKLANLHVLFQQTSIGVDRLRELLREQPSVREAPDAQSLPGFADRLTFHGVHFSYGGREVLQSIDLDIARGRKIGLAGESGSGKSTLVNLLFRFYDPTRGRVTLDQRDLRSVRVHDLRALMALVSQETVIFDQTVAENIACGRPDATRADVEAAARAAFAHDFIEQLPHGYDTRVGERGVTLSGGQRQRVAIARAFVRNAPILVLDEATASLDAEAEMEVQRGLDRLTESRTVICVAHRLATLARMDEIIVLAQGAIVERGSYEQLLRAGGLFARMAARQGLVPAGA